MLCVDDDEGVTKHLQELPPVCPFQLNAGALDWRNFSLWNSPIASNEAMQIVTVKVIVFDFKTARMSLIRNITLQSGLSVDKKEIDRSMQVSKVQSSFVTKNGKDHKIRNYYIALPL